MQKGDDKGWGEVVERKVHGEAEAKAGECPLLRREIPSVTQAPVGEQALSYPSCQNHVLPTKTLTVGG